MDSSAYAQTPAAGLTNVHNVALHDAIISWESTSGATDLVKIEELLFILDLSALKHKSGYILFCLKEHVDNRDDPFSFVGLSTDKIPKELHAHLIDRLPEYVVPTDENAVDVIVSTKSGINQSLAFWQTVLQPVWDILERELASSDSPAPLPSSKATRNILITQDARSVREFARRLSTSGGVSSSHSSRTIVLLSGDGGVVDLLNEGVADAPHEQQLLLALLPLGTGNALFHSLHKPVWTEEHNPSPLVLGLRTLFAGAKAQLPVFRATFSEGSHIVKYTAEGDALARRDVAVEKLYGAVVASYGFHASIVYESDTPEYRVHGAKRFGMAAQELLRLSHSYRGSVQVRPPGGEEGALFEPIAGDEHLYVLVTPLSNLERTFTISPASRPLDGKLRLVHFGNVGGQRAMDVMMKAYDGGKHVGMKWDDGHEVRYEEIEEIRVTTAEEDERWRMICIDGTIVELPKGGQVSVSKEKRDIFKVLVDSRVLPGQ
ncbi:hypothetical protein PT974_00972 [Cladobotryum mycophilum]|uniref:DAGKc domain-containing protein n=1 Tax=Cladobotryum mycophilum TaxID=491253 RepID=A0ABR0T2D8_9HYPO